MFCFLQRNYLAVVVEVRLRTTEICSQEAQMASWHVYYLLDLLVRLLVLLVLDHAKPADLVVGKSLCFLWSSSLSSLVSILRITQPVAISVTVTSFASIVSDVDTRSPNVVLPFRETNSPSVGLPTCGRRWRDSSLCYCQPCEGSGETFTCPYCVTDLSTSFMFNCSTTHALSYPT